MMGDRWRTLISMLHALHAPALFHASLCILHPPAILALIILMAPRQGLLRTLLRMRMEAAGHAFYSHRHINSIRHQA